MNIVEIAGHLGADPETRVTPNGLKITNLRLAASARRAGKDETIWWRVTIFGDRFEKMLPHMKKGSALIVLGELNKPEIWMDKEGRPQITLEVVAEMIKFSPFGKPDRQQDGSSGYGQSGVTQQQNNSYSQSAYSQPNHGGYNNAYQEQRPYGGESLYGTSGDMRAPQSSMGAGNTHNDDEIPF